MSEQTKAIRARLEAATPGPWRMSDEESIVGPGWEEIVGGKDFFFWSDGDQRLIAAAPDDLRYLLAEVAAAEARGAERERAMVAAWLRKEVARHDDYDTEAVMERAADEIEDAAHIPAPEVPDAA